MDRHTLSGAHVSELNVGLPLPHPFPKRDPGLSSVAQNAGAAVWAQLSDLPLKTHTSVENPLSRAIN